MHVHLVLLEKKGHARRVAFDAIGLEGLHRCEIERWRYLDSHAGKRVSGLLEHLRRVQ